MVLCSRRFNNAQRSLVRNCVRERERNPERNPLNALFGNLCNTAGVGRRWGLGRGVRWIFACGCVYRKVQREGKI